MLLSSCIDRSGPARLVLVVGAAALLPGCGFASNVRESFARDFTCPADAIHVKERPDIQARSLLPPPQPPSAEVAADPARMAEWNRQQEAARKRVDDFNVYDADGCGHTQRYACAEVAPGEDRGVDCVAKGPTSPPR